jgi:pyruvate/2-oxoglutarate dehydrogenase complex dihydrolipoamide dehydrogenase (E3) component
MASVDYDVVIIRSGFGGSAAALRAVETGYRVGVRSGRPSAQLAAAAANLVSTAVCRSSVCWQPSRA